jgi:DNA-binding MarR family transcriptional regulator
MPGKGISQKSGKGRAAAGRGRGDGRLPVTVTRKALLVDGSDQRFRLLLQNFFTMSQQLHALRAVLAKRLGVTEPEYRILLAIAQLEDHDGVGVGAIAKHLMVSGPFVTAVGNKLIRRNFIAKRESDIDRRGVLLSLTAYGRQAFADFAKVPQAINDEAFRSLDADDFAVLSAIVQRLVEDGERALVLARLYELEEKSTKAGSPVLHSRHAVK